MDEETKSPAVEKKEDIKPLKGIPVPLLRQSNGKPSASFTIMFFTFNVCLLWLLLSIVEGFAQIKIRQFDFSGVSLLLGLVFGLYFSRRLTDAKGEAIPVDEDKWIKSYYILEER